MSETAAVNAYRIATDEIVGANVGISVDQPQQQQ